MLSTAAPLRGVLLGLLVERPSHRGELAARAQERLGETWRINRIGVYGLLEQLEKEGLTRPQEAVHPGADGRKLLVFHPTERTVQALTEWMETITPRDSVRLGIHAKLAVARKEDAPRLVLALREYERESLALAQALVPGEAGEHSWQALCVECQRDIVLGMLRAEVAWAERTRARIEAYLVRI